MKHYINEAGTEIVLDTGILIGSATEQHIKYQNPNGVEGTWSASLYSSYSELAGTIGTYLLQHTLATTDLTIPGMWLLHAYVGSVNGTWLGELVELEISDQFE